MRRLFRTSSLLGLVAFLALGGTEVQSKGPPPPPCTVTSVEATYPMIVESGVPAQLQVTLLNGTSPVACTKPIDITTTDRKAKKATLLLSRDGGFLFELALVTGPTQSVTVAVGAASTTISGIQVSTNSLSVEPGISTLVTPKRKQLVAIPTNNNVIDDGALDGGISLNGQIYFFASNGMGGKLYSYDPVGGVQQRSNTNPTGPDHQWAGGVRVVNGVIYFNAFSNQGCIKIYKYAPGDPMVTDPIANVNKDMCNPIPDQIATEPDLAFGNGQTGSIPFNLGNDTPAPGYFAPIGVGTLVYFVANNGSRYDVYEYNLQMRKTRAITNLPTPVVTPDGLYLLGVNAGQLVFATADGIYQYTPGGPPVTAPTTPGTPPVGIEVATGILLNNVNYFDNGGGLASWTIGDAAPTMLSAGISNIADLGVINGTVVFSAVDNTQEREIYAYTPGGLATVTTSLVATCSSPCSEPSTPVGLIGDQFYFNGRDSSKGLKFYQTAWPVSSSVSASPAFTVNTAPMSYVVTSATLGDAVYFLSYEGFVGYLHSDKFPNYGFERGNGRSGYGNHELYVLPAGSTTAQQVFETVDIDSDGDDVASGTKYPSALTQVGDRMYFRARSDTVPGNPNPQYGLFSHAPGEGLATVKINADFQMPNIPMFAIGNTLYFIGDIGSAGNPQYKLFEHTVGDVPLVAANAISNLVPGGSDEISLLTNVGGVLFFKGTVNGNSKIYKWAPGDPPVLASSNRTDIVPGGDDAPVWNPTERRGGDSSVINGKLFFTAAGGGAYEIDASSPVPIGPGDALANIQGEGDRIVQYQGAYYLVPFNATVVDGIVYEGPGGGGVQYIREGYPIGSSPTVQYFPISSTSNQYLRACSLYGDFRLVADGVQYFWAYNPGTDLCTYMSTTPSHTAFPGFEVPFPALASSQTEFGTAGPAQGWRYDAASGWLLMRGALSPVHAILTAKSFAYRDGELVLLSPSNVGNDDVPGVPLAGTSSLFVNGDNCGGVVDWQTSMVEANCQRLYRYTPLAHRRPPSPPRARAERARS